MAAVYPWKAIEKEYVEGRRDAKGGVIYPTYDDLARKYTCALATIAARAAREKWGEKRQAYQLQQTIAQAQSSVNKRPPLTFEIHALQVAHQGMILIERALAGGGGLTAETMNGYSTALMNFYEVSCYATRRLEQGAA